MLPSLALRLGDYGAHLVHGKAARVLNISKAIFEHVQHFCSQSAVSVILPNQLNPFTRLRFVMLAFTDSKAFRRLLVAKQWTLDRS